MTTSLVAVAMIAALAYLLTIAAPKLWRWIRLWHGGYHFRSYTEIAWAKYFERNHMPYKYEPRPYFFRARNGRGVGYLPDFYLLQPRAGLGPWVEIKGKPPTEFETWKCWQLALATREHVTLLAGWPGKHRTYQYPTTWSASS